MKHRGMIHIHLKVSDLERSIRIYEQAFGLRVVLRNEADRMRFLQTPGRIVHSERADYHDVHRQIREAISRCYPGAMPQRKHCTGSPVCRPRSAAVGLFARPDGLVPYHGRLRSP